MYNNSPPDREAVLQSEKAKGVYNLRVRYVKVEGRWAKHVSLPLAAGDTLSPEKLSDAFDVLRREIDKSSNWGFGLRSKGEIAVLYISVDFDTSKPPNLARGSLQNENDVGVIFRPYYVHLSLVQIGNNVLPIPRSAFPTFYENIPRPLVALNLAGGASYDRAFGAALSAAFDTDLLSLPGATFSHPNEHLEMQGQGTKSLEEPFYLADIGLRYSTRKDAGLLQELAINSNFQAMNEPLGSGEHSRKAENVSLALKLKLLPNTRLWLDAGYRRADDSVRDSPTNSDTSADEQTGRLLLDAIPPSIYGFLRAALWQENGWQTGLGAAYQRLVGRIGYEKELPLAPSQTIGIELAAGGGKNFGDVPSYARFFGGNPTGQFLYDSPSAMSLTTMPSGPVIRSFGDDEAMLRDKRGRSIGADTFWHVNLNLTFPIPSFSRPLIPNESTDIDDVKGNPISLKRLLGNQIDVTGPNMLAATLKNQGMSDQEAAVRAREILQEISPAAHFIIDNADLYSIKPLIMFDAAGMSSSGISSETWLAAGGGIQLTMVTTKFEAGYMQTVAGPTFGSHHNIFFRLVFQNLF